MSDTLSERLDAALAVTDTNAFLEQRVAEVVVGALRQRVGERERVSWHVIAPARGSRALE